MLVLLNKLLLDLLSLIMALGLPRQEDLAILAGDLGNEHPGEGIALNEVRASIYALQIS